MNKSNLLFAVIVRAILELLLTHFHVIGDVFAGIVAGHIAGANASWGALAGLLAGSLGGLIVGTMLMLLGALLTPILGMFSLIFMGGAVLIALLTLKAAFFTAIGGIIGSVIRKIIKNKIN